MRVIIPASAPVLITSTIPEPDTGEAVYASGTSYALGARVISTTAHRIYESLQAANQTHALPVPPETATDWWMDVGVTNQYACFDLARNTQSVGNSPIEITFTPGERVNAIAVMGMEADSLRIQMHTSTGLKYDATFDLKLRVVRDGYEYAFKPFDRQPSVVKFDLPPYSINDITLTIARTDGQPVKVGSILAGTYIYLGATEYNATNDALNFSTIERDIYGTATLIPRRTLPKTNQTCWIDKMYVNDLLDARARLNAVPAAWSGLDDKSDSGYFEALLILGIYKQFSIDLSEYNRARLTLELEEI